MNGREFVRRARRYARKTGQDFQYYPERGKGSHGRIHVGGRLTTVPYKEIRKGLLASMLRDLNIAKEEF